MLAILKATKIHQQMTKQITLLSMMGKKVNYDQNQFCDERKLGLKTMDPLSH